MCVACTRADVTRRSARRRGMWRASGQAKPNVGSVGRRPFSLLSHIDSSPPPTSGCHTLHTRHPPHAPPLPQCTPPRRRAAAARALHHASRRTPHGAPRRAPLAPQPWQRALRRPTCARRVWCGRMRRGGWLSFGGASWGPLYLTPHPLTQILELLMDSQDLTQDQAEGTMQVRLVGGQKGGRGTTYLSSFVFLNPHPHPTLNRPCLPAPNPPRSPPSSSCCAPRAKPEPKSRAWRAPCWRRA